MNLQPVNELYNILQFGFKVFPLRAGTKADQLLRSWKAEATADRAKIDEWARRWPGCNWGIATGETVLCDPYNPRAVPDKLLVIDCDGQDAYDWFVGRYPQLRNTLSVDSGRDDGGGHVYLWAPPSCELTIASHILLPADAPQDLKIDVRCEGGYVVAPGSIHPSGRRYRIRSESWQGDDDDLSYEIVIQYAPAEWFDGRDAKHLLVGASLDRPQPVVSATPVVAPDGDYSEQDWLKYYNRAAEQIVEDVATCADGEGHEVLWDAACRLYELTQPWQADPACLLQNAVQRWSFRKGGRGLRAVLADLQMVCRDASKKVTRVDPRTILYSCRAGEDGIELCKADEDLIIQGCRKAAASPALTTAPTAEPATKSSDELDLTRDKKGRVERTSSNLFEILEHDTRLGHLAYNESAELMIWRVAPSEFPEWQGRAPRDTDFDEINLLIEKYHNQEWPFEKLCRTLLAIAQRRPYNAFLEDIQSHEWDHKDRLSHAAAAYFGAEDTEYNNEILRRWLIGLCARQYATFKNPVKMDYVLLLQGPQGCGKTSGLEALAGTGFCKATALEPSNKDSIMALHSAPVVVFDELGGRQRRDIEAVKNFITTEIDVFRKPYARVIDSIPRRCALAATTNEDAPLLDATGNRRWWIQKCGRIDVEGLKTDRAQILAQALAEYKAWMNHDIGARPWWFQVEDESLSQAATLQQNQAVQTDEIENEVIECVNTMLTTRSSITIREIVEDVYRPENTEKTLELVQKNKHIIATILKVRCGLESYRTSKGMRWKKE